MKQTKNIPRQFFISLLAVVLVASASYPFAGWIGYRSVALLLLLTLSLLAMRMSLYPVLAAATLSALVWNFFFIPPKFTFHIGSVEDGLMFAMYFIVALLNGVLMARIRRAEETARQKEERANAVKLYDTLFNTLSHELRTPIASILGASDNLLSNSRLDEKNRQELCVEIGNSAERLNRLTDNLLNSSRLESGFIQPKLDWVDLRELIYSALKRLDKELKKYYVVVDTPEELPLFKLDFGLLETALTNLFYNASLYTPENSEINVSADFEENQCVVTVIDSGPGFPTEEMAAAFEKFYRPKNAPSGGLGLGLSIAKGFVEAHGGTISVENEPGAGAKFTIRIPAESLILQVEEAEKQIAEGNDGRNVIS